MVNVPDKATRRAAYERSIGSVPASYKAGVEATQGWQKAAVDGQTLYEQRMQDSSVLRRRLNSLQKVTDQDWKAKASMVGSQRIASGMTAGAQKQADNYEPIAEALRNVSLPARTGDAMANIDARVKPIVQAAINASPKNR
ncbi:TPA_asm: hypothetical protein vir530_00034 [dsDNA virus vir530]|jgi:hypothetical protein|nr:TPA_asm: hypothetical protein vir530_00034 [dsDNA virus vir530]